MTSDEKIAKVKESSYEAKGKIRKNPYPMSPALKLLKEKFKEMATSEEKAQLTINFMKETLAEGESFRFKNFWEAKRLCMDIFKGPMDPIARSRFWGDFIELTLEAKKLRDILDEQAAFSIEQIELALGAIANELESGGTRIKSAFGVGCPKITNGLISNEDQYDLLQRELNFLKTVAIRLTSLRKEVIETEMRTRSKNQLLLKISRLGDLVFPRKKVLMKEVSEAYVKDVASFVEVRFKGALSDQEKRISLYVLRNDIKMLQALAKSLFLTTDAFNTTRQLLSTCWEKLREVEKGRKKEFSLKSEDFKKNYELLFEKIKILEKSVEETGSPSGDALRDQTDRILVEMGTLELTRDGIKALKSGIQKILKTNDLFAEEARCRNNKILIENREKVKKSLVEVIQSKDKHSVEELQLKQRVLQKEYGDLKLSGPETIVYEQLIQDFTSFILDRKEQEAIQSLEMESLENVYNLRVEYRDQVKRQLEECRRELGGSGFDFEKAMIYREYIDGGKVRLDQANVMLEQLEDKIEKIHE